MKATCSSQSLVSTCDTASVLIKNTTAWRLTTLTSRQLILDKQAYLNNKINQSKINSNGKRQEEIKDGWFNTEIHKKWHWISLISLCSVTVRRIQVKEQKITQILTSTLVWSNIFTCLLCNLLTSSSNLYTAFKHSKFITFNTAHYRFGCAQPFPGIKAHNLKPKWQ
jgi:hypothetical protein